MKQDQGVLNSLIKCPSFIVNLVELGLFNFSQHSLVHFPPLVPTSSLCDGCCIGPSFPSWTLASSCACLIVFRLVFRFVVTVPNPVRRYAMGCWTACHHVRRLLYSQVKLGHSGASTFVDKPSSSIQEYSSSIVLGCGKKMRDRA